nr:MAG TPA: hypothetical protein [Caudoviricetes sp.]
MLLILPFIAAASVATIQVLLRVVTHGREDTIVTTVCFISHIVWFNVQIKNPTVLTNGGASVLFYV